jgi:ribose transport system permease protein
MIRLLGVLVPVAVLYAAGLASDPGARSWNYQQQFAGYVGFYGVLTLGVGILIISGGIDLSIGSLVGLGAVCFGLMLGEGVNPILAALTVLAGSLLVGLIHGLLVTQLRLQPFLVTLCGLFIYRGLAKTAATSTVGLLPKATAESTLAVGQPPPSISPLVKAMKEWLVGAEGEGGRNQLFVLLLVAFLFALFLHGTRHGRYLFAIGANEEAARYAGIPTNPYKVLAYVICSGLAGLGSILYLLSYEVANPTTAGNLLELYAITGAVLGGCSLRGGDGMIPGMILGAAVLPLLKALCGFLGKAVVTFLKNWFGLTISGDDLEYVVIGLALLLGTIADELLKRRAARRPA